MSVIRTPQPNYWETLTFRKYTLYCLWSHNDHVILIFSTLMTKPLARFLTLKLRLRNSLVKYSPKPSFGKPSKKLVLKSRGGNKKISHIKLLTQEPSTWHRSISNLSNIMLKLTKKLSCGYQKYRYIFYYTQNNISHYDL